MFSKVNNPTSTTRKKLNLDDIFSHIQTINNETESSRNARLTTNTIFAFQEEDNYSSIFDQTDPNETIMTPFESVFTASKINEKAGIDRDQSVISLSSEMKTNLEKMQEAERRLLAKEKQEKEETEYEKEYLTTSFNGSLSNFPQFGNLELETSGIFTDEPGFFHDSNLTSFNQQRTLERCQTEQPFNQTVRGEIHTTYFKNIQNQMTYIKPFKRVSNETETSRSDSLKS